MLLGDVSSRSMRVALFTAVIIMGVFEELVVASCLHSALVQEAVQPETVFVVAAEALNGHRLPGRGDYGRDRQADGNQQTQTRDTERNETTSSSHTHSFLIQLSFCRSSQTMNFCLF